MDERNETPAAGGAETFRQACARDGALERARRLVLGLLAVWVGLRAALLPAALLAGRQELDFWLMGALGLVVSAVCAVVVYSGTRLFAVLAVLGTVASVAQSAPAFGPYLAAGGGYAAYTLLFLAGNALQLAALACLFALPAARRYFKARAEHR